MASRQEEKERRRCERVEAEQAAQRAASRKRMLRIGGGAVLGIAVIAAIAVVALAGGGSDKADTSNLTADAKAAGGASASFKAEGRTHTTGKVKYKTNPPTSGPHNPTPAQDGIYAPGNSPAKENFVHTLEHGRIEFQYKPGTRPADIAKLRSLAEEPFKGTDGYHDLLFENNTGMPAQFAATGWTRMITCPTLTPQAMDAMRAFRKAF